MTRRQVVRAAGQLGAGLRLHRQCSSVGGHTARQQVRVSEVRQQRQPDPGRQRQRREEPVPEQVIVIGQSSDLRAAGRAVPLRRVAGKEAVAGDVQEDRAICPARDVPAGSLQERKTTSGRSGRPCRLRISSAERPVPAASGSWRSGRGTSPSCLQWGRGDEEEGEAVGVV